MEMTPRVGPSVYLWIYDEPKEIKHYMHGTIPNVFDFGASTIVHHLL